VRGGTLRVLIVKGSLQANNLCEKFDDREKLSDEKVGSEHLGAKSCLQRGRHSYCKEASCSTGATHVKTRQRDQQTETKTQRGAKHLT